LARTEVLRKEVAIMEFVIASQNPAKVRELRLLFQELFPDAYIRSLLEFPDIPLPQGGQNSFEENAVAKATWAAKKLQKPCVCDESGLIVPYLGDAVESLRRKSIQPENVKLPDTKRLLKDLEGVDDFKRAAFLECVLAFAVPSSGVVKTVSARMEGSIATKEKGAASFDFASVFVKDGYATTLAELSSSVQARISHRRKACEKLYPGMQKALALS
jgi:XTP/dITP diphosphohydrolase